MQEVQGLILPALTRQLPIVRDTLHAIEPSQSLKPDAPAGWKADGDDLYKGNNPSVPVTGDVRVIIRTRTTGTAFQ